MGSEKFNPALAVIVQAAQEQANSTGQIDVNAIIKQIAGKYTIGGKEVIKRHANGTEKPDTRRG